MYYATSPVQYIKALDFGLITATFHSNSIIMENMKRRNASSMLLLLICLTTVNHLSLAEEHSTLLRSKRRIQEVSTSAIEYMQRLRNSLTDEEGKPTLSNAEDPTEVWAMQDRGR